MEKLSDEKIKLQINEALQTARTMRDQIRLEIHLAGMEGQARWRDELEPRLADAERFAHEVSEATRTAATSVATSFREFRDSLRRHAHHPHDGR